MRRAICIMNVTLLGSVGVGSPAQAQNVDGRYLGSYSHVDAQGVTTDRMRHLYDATIREALPREMTLDLGASLRYELEPGDLSTDILRSRLYGNVRSRTWRVHAQYVPWQRTQPSSPIPSRSDLQTGFEWTPRRGPALRLNFNRADRETGLGTSRSEDRRVELQYVRAGIGTNVGYRRLVSLPAGRGARTDTDEYRAGIRGQRNWRDFSVGGSYDAVITDRTSMVREIDQDLQNANITAAWRPAPKLTVSSHLQRRWGTTRDSGLPFDQQRRELFTGARLGYLPLPGLSLDARREYRRTQVAGGYLTSDYIRVETVYRRAVVRRTTFQTGYLQTIDLRSRGGGLPLSSVFVNFEGMLRQAIRTRAEVRASASPTRATGTQWRNVLQFITRPTRATRFDVLWQRDILPEIAGMQQHDRRWELLAGYQLPSGANLVGSYRRLDGDGRIERQENFWSLTTSWRVANRTTMSVNASTRDTRLQKATSNHNIISVEMTYAPAPRTKVRGSWRRSRTAGQRRDMSWNVIFSQSF